MIVVPNQLCSFHYSQVPGFQRIFELSRQHSYGPEGVDESLFANLPAEDRLSVRLETLDHFPNEEEILKQEPELSRHKGDRSAVSPLRDVENLQMQQVLAGLESAVPTV